MAQQVFLVRHGETEWALTGQHTGHTDIPLTERGREQARLLCAELSQHEFAAVFSSPLSRALDTCRLACLGDQCETADDLMEWDYGEYEGLSTADIRTRKPKWSLWLDGAPNGETAADLGARADRIVKEIRALEGDVAIFGHGHLSRVLAARWIGLAPVDGRLFALDPATISILGYERETPVIQRWNDPGGHP
jgi:probable phosphoglycerate mutase